MSSLADNAENFNQPKNVVDDSYLITIYTTTGKKSIRKTARLTGVKCSRVDKAITKAGVKIERNPAQRGRIPWNKGKKNVQIAWNKGKQMGPSPLRGRPSLIKGIPRSPEIIQKIKDTKRKDHLKQGKFFEERQNEIDNLYLVKLKDFKTNHAQTQVY